MSKRCGLEPIRTCLVCGRRRPRGELRRLILVGEVVMEDRDGRTTGRGGYCCLEGDCRQRLAVEGEERKWKKRMARAFRARDTHIGILLSGVIR